MIIALAGRRIDAQDVTTPRFPLGKSASVHERIIRLLREQQASALVSSAACGADLLALAAAGALGIRRHVVLPFSCQRFREVSVVDRPGEWGGLFDQIIREVEVAGDLVFLNETKEDTATFIHTNNVLLNEAQVLARQKVYGQEVLLSQDILAVIVWDGTSRGEDDVTAHFVREAYHRNIPVMEILTC
jgi:hypothetical protein